jgi:hypothetical protein
MSKKEPMVPVSELRHLYNEMFKVKAESTEERDVLYTCRCMVADVIESYTQKEVL